MPRPADLISVLLRIAAERGWSNAELARRIGFNRSTLVHVRAGRRQLSTEALARIARLFADVPSMPEVVWSYLLYDVRVGGEERGVLRLGKKHPTGLPDAATNAIRRFVREFPTRLVEGRGMIVVGASAPLLSIAAKEIASALAAARVRIHRRSARGPVGPAEAEAIARARLLVLERMDFCDDAAKALLGEFLDAERPVVVTSAKDIAAVLDEPHARLLQARTTLVRIEAPSSDRDD